MIRRLANECVADTRRRDDLKSGIGRNSVYAHDYTYIPCHVVRRALCLPTKRHADLCYTKIVDQLRRYQSNKRTVVSSDESLFKKYGRKPALEALARLSTEEVALRKRALVVQALMRSRSQSAR